MKAEDCIGTWWLRTWKNSASDGSSIDALGENPVGFIDYNYGVCISVEMMAAHHSLYHDADVVGGIAGECSEAIRTDLSDSGMYELLVDKNTVVHH